jgi:hypothetical protein
LSISQAHFLSRARLSKYTGRWFEFAKPASLLMRIAPATGNEGILAPTLVEEEPNFREHWAQT